jgi:hypothetical protein
MTAISAEREHANQINQTVRYIISGWFADYCDWAGARYSGPVFMDQVGARLAGDWIALHAYKKAPPTTDKHPFQDVSFATVLLSHVEEATVEGDRLSLCLSNEDSLELWPAVPSLRACQRWESEVALPGRPTGDC